MLVVSYLCCHFVYKFLVKFAVIVKNAAVLDVVAITLAVTALSKKSNQLLHLLYLTQQCLYDGFDCEPKESCHPNYEAYCKKHWNNGNCDQGCNSMACGYDGFDCESGPPEYADGYLVVVVMVPPEVFVNNTVDFLRDLGRTLHVVVSIGKDSNGQDMIYPYTQSELNLGSNSRIKRFLQEFSEDEDDAKSASSSTNRKKRSLPQDPWGTITGTRVWLRIDIRKCEEGTAKDNDNKCYNTIEEAANYLQTLIDRNEELDLHFPFMKAERVRMGQF